MVRIARIVAPGTPYPITHRGNQRREVFFCDRDREFYLADLAVWAHDCGLSIWGYCLMANHVHMIAVPHHTESMARAIGRVHQRHARRGASRPHPLTGVSMAWGDWLAMGIAGEADASEQLRRATLTGRPSGGEDFIERLERQLGRSFECRKPGSKPSSTFSEDENQYELF